MNLQSLEKAFSTAKKHEDTMDILFVLKNGIELKAEYCARNDTREFLIIRDDISEYYFVDFNDVFFVKLKEKNSEISIGFETIKNESEAK